MRLFRLVGSGLEKYLFRAQKVLELPKARIVFWFISLVPTTSSASEMLRSDQI